MKITESDAMYIEGVVRPLIRSLRRNMRIVMGEDDLTQECLVRALTSSKAFVREDGLWKKIARNICIDQARTEKAEKKALFALPAAEAGDSDEATEKWLNHLLTGCSWELQKMVRMKMAGFSDQEIADKTGRDRRVVRATLLKVADFVEKNRG